MSTNKLKNASKQEGKRITKNNQSIGIHQAIAHIPLDGYVVGWGLSGSRLALQPVLVWWSLFCAGVVNWPFNNSTNTSRMQCQ